LARDRGPPRSAAWFVRDLPGTSPCRSGVEPPGCGTRAPSPPEWAVSTPAMVRPYDGSDSALAAVDRMIATAEGQARERARGRTGAGRLPDLHDQRGVVDGVPLRVRAGGYAGDDDVRAGDGEVENAAPPVRLHEVAVEILHLDELDAGRPGDVEVLPVEVQVVVEVAAANGAPPLPALDEGLVRRRDAAALGRIGVHGIERDPGPATVLADVDLEPRAFLLDAIALRLPVLPALGRHHMGRGLPPARDLELGPVPVDGQRVHEAERRVSDSRHDVLEGGVRFLEEQNVGVDLLDGIGDDLRLVRVRVRRPALDVPERDDECHDRSLV